MSTRPRPSHWTTAISWTRSIWIDRRGADLSNFFCQTIDVVAHSYAPCAQRLLSPPAARCRSNGRSRVRVTLRRSSIARETIARHSKQPQARRRVQAPRSTDEASRRIVFLAQFLSHALAIFCRKFRAWRIKQVDTDALTLLPLPVSAAGMIVETHPLIGARPHIDNAEDRRPGWPAL